MQLNIRGTHAGIWQELEAIRPGVKQAVESVYAGLDHYTKREVRDYEAGLLFILAEEVNRLDAMIFEIGTCWGWTAAIMATAAPLARVITCTPNPNHIIKARENLRKYPQVLVEGARSVDLLGHYALLDMIFVDGDHKAVEDDMPWFNALKPGGLMIFHDYCPEYTKPRPCRWVYDAVNRLAERTHTPDILVIDDHEEGMAGFYRQEGERS